MIDKKYLAVFDFDGTITKKDTFPDFIFFSCGWKKLLTGGLKSLPILFFYFLRIIPADKAKEKIFSIFFAGMEEDEFNRLAQGYSLQRVSKILRPAAMEKIQWHKEQGHSLIIVSASMENWINSWAQKNGFDKIIATRLEIKEGKLTGRFDGKNCNREEKVKRFLAEYPDRQDYFLYVYGNSYKDRWILNIADKK